MDTQPNQMTPSKVDRSQLMHSAPIRILRAWLEPRSTNRDEAFRERTVRVTVLITIITMVAALIFSRLVFRTEWTLLSLPSLLLLALVFPIAAGIAVTRQRVLMAGWLLVAMFVVGVGGIILLFASVTALLVLPAAMLAVLVGALLLPRSAIIPTALANVGLFIIMSALPGQYADNPLMIVINNLTVLMVEALFLRQLRVEFDSRLAAMSSALHETEMARHEADQANQAKSQFLANMSHELRTPLNAIIGYAEIMIGGMAGPFADKQVQLISHIHENGKRLLDLINGILDLARVEAGRVEIIATPNSPRKVIASLVDNMQSLAQKKKLRLYTTFREDMPEAVVCDAGKVQQVATNLIGNSLKFTSVGEVEVTAGSSDDHTWFFKVRDTGTGMPPDKVDTIFEMFSQLDNADTREHQGTGLGLAITKRLVERMGGRIEVETKLGTGSTFTVTLPRVLLPHGADGEVKPGLQGEAPALPGKTGHNAAPVGKTPELQPATSAHKE